MTPACLHASLQAATTPICLDLKPILVQRRRSLSLFIPTPSPLHSPDESVINPHGAGGKVIHLG